MKIVKLLSVVRVYIDRLSDEDGAKMRANIQTLENCLLAGLFIKTLRGKIKELIIGPYRVIYFEIGSIIYVVSAFRKKGQKTPQAVIRNAIHSYRLLKTIKPQTALKP